MKRFVFAVLAAWCGVLTVAIPAAADPVILWRLENSFRFFIDPSDTEVHRATYRALQPDEKLQPVLSSEYALQLRHSDGWADSMYKKICWDPARNQFTCGEYDDYMNPKSHAIVAQIRGLDDAATLSCTWLTAPIGGRNNRRGDAVTQPCNEPVDFDVPYPGGLDIRVEIGGREIASADAKVRDILVAAIGDSFGSGEGNPDVPVRFSPDRTADYSKAGRALDLTNYPARVGDWKVIGDPKFIAENARWQDQACHRSLYSNQLRAALQLAVEDPHRAVTYVGVACSGAEVTAGLFLRYKGNEWVPNPPPLSQISALAEAQCGQRETQALDLPEAYHINGQIPELKGGLVLRKCKQDYARKIDLLLVSIGGNDIGFSRLVANAVLSSESVLRKLGGWLGQVHGQAQANEQLSRLDARYKSLNRAFHNLLYIPWNQSDRVVLTGYPGLALSGDGSETCKDGNSGLEVFPDFQLSEQKLKEGIYVADRLHRVMRTNAERYGWTFVESHRRAFIDRGICSGSTEEGTRPSDDLRIPRKVKGVWKPYNPMEYQAYAARQRWFRTPNDAFMTANFHVANSYLTKALKFESLAWTQLLLASTYSGSFHPTAEGNAAIADAITDKARTVLKKYGQGPDPEPSFDDYPAAAPEPVDEPGVAEPQLPPSNEGVSAPSSTTGSITSPPENTEHKPGKVRAAIERLRSIWSQAKP